jgi:hypothetical protein
MSAAPKAVETENEASMLSPSVRTFLAVLLDPWEELIGPDYEGYKNHVYRMVACCLALRQCSEEDEQKLCIAGCFHDIGLWTARTLDYLPPSVPPAIEYLQKNGLAHWSEEIRLMIEEHHKLTRYRGTTYPLVELFRQGDLVDFSLGLVRFGLPASFITELNASYPNAGFHRNLVRMASRWFIRHPFNPAPMMKW